MTSSPARNASPSSSSSSDGFEWVVSDHESAASTPRPVSPQEAIVTIEGGVQWGPSIEPREDVSRDEWPYIHRVLGLPHRDALVALSCFDVLPPRKEGRPPWRTGRGCMPWRERRRWVVHAHLRHAWTMPLL